MVAGSVVTGSGVGSGFGSGVGTGGDGEQFVSHPRSQLVYHLIQSTHISASG